MPPRAVSVLTLVQLLVIVLGVMLTGTFLKLAEVVHGGMPLPMVPEAIRHHGFWLGLLPLVWAVVATFSVQTLDDLPQVRRSSLMAGYVLLGLLILFLTGTTLTAMDWAVARTHVHVPLQG